MHQIPGKLLLETLGIAKRDTALGSKRYNEGNPTIPSQFSEAINRLSNKNDNGANFKQIAAYLRKTYSKTEEQK